MAFSLNTLTAYVEQHATELKLRAYYSAKTLTIGMETMQAVKGPTTINKLGTELILQAGGCGFNASGNTSITQRVITPGSWKINQSFCPKDLETYFTRKYLPQGQGYEALPNEVEQAFSEAIMGEVGEAIEKQLWQGDITSVDVNMNKFDGFNKVLDGASGSTISTGATSGWTVATSFDIVDGIYLALPVAVREKGDAVILMGTDKVTQYGIRGRNLNYFHYQAGEVATFEYVHPGTQARVIGVPGLNGTNRIYGGQLSNFFIGFDDTWESTYMDLFFAKEADEVRFVMKNMTGVQVAYPEEIVRQITT